MATLKDKAILVNLNIKAWSGYKHDKTITQEVNDLHNMHDAGRYNKQLVSREFLKPVQTYAGQIRTYHYSKTLPWSKGGENLLPSALLQEYTTKIGDMASAYRRLVKKHIIDRWDDIHADAKSRLNGKYDPLEFPAQERLMTMFEVNVDLLPFPDAQDFRLNIDPLEQEALRKEIEKNVNARVDGTIQHIMQKGIDLVNHMHEKLSDTKATFRNSLIGNIKEFLEEVPKLNYAGSKKIDAMSKQLQYLCDIDADDLRADDGTRHMYAQRAKDVLESII